MPRAKCTRSPLTSAPAAFQISSASGSSRKSMPISSRMVSALCLEQRKALFAQDLVVRNLAGDIGDRGGGAGGTRSPLRIAPAGTARVTGLRLWLIQCRSPGNLGGRRFPRRSATVSRESAHKYGHCRWARLINLRHALAMTRHSGWLTPRTQCPRRERTTWNEASSHMMCEIRRGQLITGFFASAGVPLPNKYASRTLRAMGAAAAAPKPPFSTRTEMAIWGSSAGA